MARGKISHGIGPQCPQGHGTLLYWEPGRWYCAHRAHDGRPRSHPDGASTQSMAFFTDEELRQKES